MPIFEKFMLATHILRKQTCFLLLAVVALCLTLPALSMSNVQEQSLQESEQQLDKIKRSISQIKRWIRGAEDKQSDLTRQLRQAEQEIGDSLRSIRRLESKILATQERLKTLASHQKKQKNALREQRHLMAEQMRAAHAMGREQGLKLLLNFEDPIKIKRLLNYYSYFNEARGQRIVESRQLLFGLQQTQNEVLSNKQTLLESKAELEKNHRFLAAGRDKRAAALAKLNKSLGGKEHQLVNLEQDQQRLEELIKALQKAVAAEMQNDPVPFDTLRGKLSWPTQGQLVRGKDYATGRLGSNGVFFKTESNEAVSAVHHGRVVFADWLKGFGLLLILDHGDGFMSLYGFNQTLLKDTGDWVASAEVIANAGNSGGQSESGLYFEIRHKGKPRNPLDWLTSSPKNR